MKVSRGVPVLLALAFARPALAETRDPVAAEALFDQARQLMKDGNFAEACPKLEASQRLDPGVGTLLNLADCFEKMGRYASAWVRFREAASAALSAGQTEREKIARDRASALENRLARLVIRVPQAPEGLVLARDGATIDRELWGSAIPVDPGGHAVDATAPGKKPWHVTVTVPAAADVVRLEVPTLEDAPAPAAPPPPAPRVFADPPRPADEKSHGLGTQRGLAIGGAGLGVIALALAGGFALSARSTYSDARAHCTSAGCDPDGVRLGHDAGSSADVATISAAIGGVALAAAVVLWVTARQ